jgi:predicted O-methyltransferase YrrM
MLKKAYDVSRGALRWARRAGNAVRRAPTELQAGARAPAELPQHIGHLESLPHRLEPSPTEGPAPAPGTTFPLDYPVRPRPRWGYGRPEHRPLRAILDSRRDAYAALLGKFLPLRDELWRIPCEPDERAPTAPAWVNPWFAGLDAVALYGLVATTKPKRYLEIGSGHSTKFARRAIADHRLDTTVTSIDPAPRAEIDSICDRLVRLPVEDVELNIFDELESGDILFVDNSHRVLMNSDATTVFLDVLPRLRPGVLVHFHDVFLPADYPPQWAERFYSEQYLLAAYLIAEWPRLEVLLPNAFVSADAALLEVIEPLWRAPQMRGVRRLGLSFWLAMR